MRAVALITTLMLSLPPAMMSGAALAQECAERESAPKQTIVFFSEQSADLSDLAQRVLDTQVALLDGADLTLTGEASLDEGDEAVALSLARAEAVRDYLLARGVEPGHVAVTGSRVNLPGERGPMVSAELRQRQPLLLN